MTFFPLPSSAPQTNYQSGQVAVTTTPTLIATIEGNQNGTLVGNGTGATVFLGGPTVSTTTGFPLAVSTNVVIPAYGGARLSLYGVVASTGTTVSFLHPTA